MKKQVESVKGSKVCSKCGVERDSSEFYKKRDTKDGLSTICRICQLEQKKEYYQENKEQLVRKKRRYRKENKEKLKEITRKYREKHKDEIKIRQKDYYEKNREKLKKSMREYYEKNKDKIRKQAREYRLENIEQTKSRYKEWYAKTRDERIAYNKAYYEEHKEELKRKQREWNERNREKIRERDKKYYRKYEAKIRRKAKEQRESQVTYATYGHQLTVDEMPTADKDGHLLARCTYCGRHYYPNQSAVTKRLNALMGISRGESRLYCSDRCKRACPIFKKVLWPAGYKQTTSREVQPELRQMRFVIDDYACQKCDKTIDEVELHCHHIEGVEQNPIESADLDICITLCKKCHKWAHTQEGCRYFELQCK